MNQGKVEFVDLVPAGTQLAVAVDLAGGGGWAGELHVLDASDFDESGGTLLIGEDPTVTANILEYTGVDYDNNIIFMGVVPPDMPEDTQLCTWPLAYQKYVLIDYDEEEEPAWALVPHDLQGSNALEEGVADPGYQVTVSFYLNEEDEYVVESIDGQTFEIPVSAVPGAVDQPSFDQAMEERSADTAAAQARADAAWSLADSAQTSANGKNKTTYSAVAGAPSTSGRTDGDLHFVRVGATITEQWRFVTNAWVKETLTAATISSLDAGVISTGFLAADRLQANSIRVSKLVVGTIADNAILNPSFEDDLDGWTPFGTTSGTVEMDTTTPVSGSKVVKITKTGTTASPGIRNSPTFIPIASGKWWVSCRVRAAAAVNDALTFRFLWYDTSKTLISVTNIVSLYDFVNTTWNILEGTNISPPANTAYFLVDVFIPTAVATGTIIYVDEFQARELVGGVQIEDNAITAAKVAADAITAKHTITGPLFQTNAAANRGIKIVSSANSSYGSLTAYDAAGLATFTLNGQTGDVTIKGNLTSGSTITGTEITGGKFQTATTGQRLVINDDEEAGSIKGFTGDAAHVAPTLINPKILGSGVSRRQVLYLSSGALGGGIARVEVRSGSVDNTSWAPRIYLDAGDTEVGQRLIVRGSSTLEASMTFTGSNINMTGGADPNLVYTRIATSNGGLGTGDAGWNDSGALIRKGSNRALKKNVRPLSKKEAMAALRMEAVTFQWKKSQDLGDRRTAGFIAEQADEAGADLWLLRDGQGAPSGVRYAELTAAHNVLIQDLLDRVALLETAKG